MELDRQVDALARYYTELGRRLGRAGVRDVGELLALHEQVRQAMAALSQQEIGWAVEQAEASIDALSRVEGQLRTLKSLKVAFEPLA
ncbi:MAG: hypothetical protein U0807_17140 [Candidatus Binatia bacterium]